MSKRKTSERKIKECSAVVLQLVAGSGGKIKLRDLVEELQGKKLTEADEKHYQKEGFNLDENVEMTPKGHAAIGRAPN